MRRFSVFDPEGVKGLSRSAPIQVLVIDDSSLVRLGFQQVLAATDEFALAGLAADWHEGMELFERSTPDMVVMDLHWPSPQTLQALRAFKDARPGVRVLVLLGSSDPAAAVAAIGHGADALVHSAVDPDTLVAVLRLLRRGDSFVIHHTVWKRIAHMLDGSAPLGPGGRLSVREQEVLALLAEGLTDREIARTLTISEPTAKHHVAHVLRKLNVSTRAAAARLARENRGYIQIGSVAREALSPQAERTAVSPSREVTGATPARAEAGRPGVPPWR
jgi:DNA-binding NarL/FixJ family response regulator